MANFAGEVQKLHHVLKEKDRGQAVPDDHGAAILGDAVLKLRQMAGDRNKMGGVYQAWLDAKLPWREVPNSVEPYNESRGLSDVGTEATAQKYPEVYLPQLETIHCGMMYGLFMQTATQADVGDVLGDVMTTAKAQLHGGWTGAAADAALKQFDKVVSSAGTYRASNNVIASNAISLWRSVRGSLVGLSRHFEDAQLYPLFGGMSAQDYKDWYPRIEYFQALTKAGITDLAVLGRITYWDDAQKLPPPPRELYTLYMLNEGHAMAQQLASWVQWLNGMSVRYSIDVKKLRDATLATADSISQQFDEFNTAVAGLRGMDGDIPKDDPFRELRPPEATAPTQTSTATEQPNIKTTGGGGGGRYAGGGGYGGGGAPSYSAPVMETPTVPSAADYPSMTDPTADPTAGITAPSAATQPETVTIADGDRQISVQSPDGQGNVKVTVDDGDGKPKTYNMDFSQGAGDTKGAPRSTGGADDKVVIKDGDSTITAEQGDGGDGRIKITVDDGTGDPTTYNVDFSGDEAPADPQQPTGQPPTDQATAQQNDHQPAANGSSPDAGSGAPRQAAVHSGATTGTADALTSSGGSTVDPQTTTPQADAAPLSGAGAAGVAGTAVGGREHHGTGFDADPGSGIAAASAPGDAQLATAPDSGNGSGSGGMAGMPMMGGGMGGGGGGGGGDSSRGGGSAWRTTGNLFADEGSAFEEGDLDSNDPADW